MQVQNYHGVLNGLVPCLKCIKLASQVLHSYFGLIIYLRLVKVMTKTLLLEMTWLYLTKEKTNNIPECHRKCVIYRSCRIKPLLHS